MCTYDYDKMEKINIITTPYCCLACTHGSSDRNFFLLGCSLLRLCLEVDGTRIAGAGPLVAVGEILSDESRIGGIGRVGGLDRGV